MLNSYAVGTLQVPWENGRLGAHLRSHKKIAVFNLRFGALPTTPGKITALYTSKVETLRSEDYNSGVIQLWADKYDGASWVTLQQTVYPKADCKFVPSSIGWHAEGAMAWKPRSFTKVRCHA
ncbi:MAG: hypothetical protein HWD61_14115 [Parachlamydiaceae bacterium]|nr:MAG: hypothetical protein HWD61_14115 [Parachlamydiaceae bacterium]